MAPHSSTVAWKIPWTEHPGRRQSMGSQRVGHDWATLLSCIGGGNGNPLQYSCLENPRHGGTWWAAGYGVAQSRTRLKRLSSSSSSMLFTLLLCVCMYYQEWIGIHIKFLVANPPLSSLNCLHKKDKDSHVMLICSIVLLSMETIQKRKNYLLANITVCFESFLHVCALWGFTWS